MNIIIPSKAKVIQQLNENKYSGNIWSSFNMDFKYGDLRLAPRGLLADNHRGTAGIGIPTDFASFKGVTICPTSTDAMFVASGDATGWAKVVQGGVYPPSDDTSSVVMFNNMAYISAASDISEWNDGTAIDVDWWTTVIGGDSLTSAKAHPLCVGFNNLMLVGDNHTISAINIREDLFKDVVNLPEAYEILWIISASDKYWIGTKTAGTNRSQKSAVFSWDGSSDNFNYEYILNAGMVYSGALVDDVLHITTDRGDLLKFNGGGFTRVATFPWYNEDYLLYHSSTHADQPIHRNGMAVIGDSLYIMVDTRPYTWGIQRTMENAPAGIWKYDGESLHHFSSVSESKSASILDYGQKYITSPSAIKGLYIGDNYSQETLFYGSRTKNDDNDYTIQYLDYQTLAGTSYHASRGYIITPRLEATEIEETWDKMFIKSDNKTGGSIIVKYRTEEEFNWTGTGTWADTTSFTSTDTGCSELAVGDEIEILNGIGGGIITTIKTISFSTPTYTITVDDTITGITATDGFYFKPNNFILLDTISATDTGVKELPIDIDSQWIQFRIEIRSGGDTPIIREVALNSTIKTKYKQ